MTTSTHAETTNAMRAALRAVLSQHGWDATGNGPALAQRQFATAVGDKRALLWLQDWGANSTQYVLAGEYTSEGRNILEPRGVMLPKLASGAELEALVDKFLRGVYDAIDDSYARRLYLRQPEAQTA